MSSFSQAALIIIDVQKAVDADYHAVHGPRNNMEADANIARLLTQWRAARRPIIHVHHDSTWCKRPTLETEASTAARPAAPEEY